MGEENTYNKILERCDFSWKTQGSTNHNQVCITIPYPRSETYLFSVTIFQMLVYCFAVGPEELGPPSWVSNCPCFDGGNLSSDMPCFGGWARLCWVRSLLQFNPTSYGSVKI